MLQQIQDWLEVWALLIPIAALLRKNKRPHYVKPVIVYVWLALIINSLANISWMYKAHYHFPVWYQTNTYFYNIHSIVRLFLFSIFFIQLRQPFLSGIKKVIPFLFLFFIVINFIFFEPFVNYWFVKGDLQSSFSNNLLSLEAIFLLFYCIQYFIFKLREDEGPVFTKLPSFWIVTGLSIFVVSSFPIYLFYGSALLQEKDFAIAIWNVQKSAFLIFCVFMAIAFLKSDYNHP